MAAKRAQHSTRAAFQKHQLSMKARKKGKANPASGVKAKKALVSQEIKLARLLASNDKKVREKILKHLRKWLTARSRSSFAFTEVDFMRLWKGLFYCMWMSDKPLIQEELADSLSKIVHCFQKKDVIFLYTKCALKTLGTEWFGIDQYRLDKFAMLARRIIRQTFQICKQTSSWSEDWVKDLARTIQEILLESKTCLGFSMHITELFFEELAKVSSGDLPKEVVTELVKPFMEQLVNLDDERQMKHIMKHIFRYLILQSDVGMEYTEKFAAWKDAGFPAGHIDAMEKLESLDENDELKEDQLEVEESESCSIEKPLDPRAGRVDVELPQILFDPKQIIDVLTQYKHHPSATAKSRRQILHLIKEFNELLEGNMPLGIKEVLVPDQKKNKNSTKAAAVRLLEFERELHSDNAPNKRKRKHGKELANDDNSEDDDIEKHSSSEDEEDLEYDNDDAIDTDEEELIPIKQSIKGSKGRNENAKDVCDSENSGTSGKKRRIKQTTKKSNMEGVDFEKKLPMLHYLGKKVKSRQKSLAVSNLSRSKPPMKKKKLPVSKVFGSWDISENTNSSTGADSTAKGVKRSSSRNDPGAKPPVGNLKKGKSVATSSTQEQGKITLDAPSKKRVKIMLNKNTAQHTSEYFQKILQSPGIPFDAEKKPLAGVLKASPIPSPINPFYRRSFK